VCFSGSAILFSLRSLLQLLACLSFSSSSFLTTTMFEHTLDDIRDDGRGDVFPRGLLRPTDTALCLFAAGFLGANDVYWLYEAGLQEVTCVDTDAERSRR
jgi:hypothetical protein